MPYNSSLFQFTNKTKINFHKNRKGLISPSNLLIQSPDRNDRCKTNRKKQMARRVRGKRDRGLHAINHYFSSLLLRSHSRQNFEKSLQLILFFISKDKKTEKRSIIINMVC